MSRRRFVWLAVAAVVVAGSFFGGRAIGSEGRATGSYAYELDTPPYAASSAGVAMSRGGFGGFGSGLDGYTIVSGRVRSISTESITLETIGGGTEVVRVTGSGVFQRIEGATPSVLRPGMTVVVRSLTGGDAAASAVLVLAEPPPGP